MRRVAGVGVAGAGVLMRVVFSLRWILYCCWISGSGSSGTPGRSSHGCSCEQAASQGWGLAEEGWCWLPEDLLGSAVVQGPDLQPPSLLLHLQLHRLRGQLRCKACHCWGASPWRGAGAEEPPGRCGWGVAGLLNCWGADGDAYGSSSYRRRRFGTRWSSLDRQTPREKTEGGRKEGKTGKEGKEEVCHGHKVGRQQNKTVERQYINRRAEGIQENSKRKEKGWEQCRKTDTVRRGKQKGHRKSKGTNSTDGGMVWKRKRGDDGGGRVNG